MIRQVTAENALRYRLRAWAPVPQLVAAVVALVAPAHPVVPLVQGVLLVQAVAVLAVEAHLALLVHPVQLLLALQ